jgi:hypothetical protein
MVPVCSANLVCWKKGYNKECLKTRAGCYPAITIFTRPFFESTLCRVLLYPPFEGFRPPKSMISNLKNLAIRRP